ncbi:malto-oligosyltrehalose trehalohydrolase [Miniimonas sp. S16]|uniref:malto-oligosyltrehalose trehalohydrolase n=1 Tax=Miniimonas sp. S16 TaxID=2171623 RepID=UPI001901F46F|nr:malto-oligosyltrehalose trehalohydrolase [Miniimonas sp. S16]
MTSGPGAAPLSVWAPYADAVAVVLGVGREGGDAHEEAMLAVGGGWWRTTGDVAPEVDYAFRLDGGDPRPDPRSPRQPAGVHGPSRTFDAHAFAWTDAAWAGRDVRGAVTYELHVGTFTPGGTLPSAIERLDHLVELGVDVVELMPLAAFNGDRGWGYDGVALYAVHEPYGGPEALQAFVDAAHARGLAVCLDVVYNHLGPSGNYLGEFGPYFTDAHTTPWGSAVNLDRPGSAEVRAFLVDNALRWLRDFHVDALRLDAVHALVDDSERHLLAELSDAVADLAREVGRPLSLVAESDLNDAVMVTPTAAGGHGMTAQWDDDVHHAVHALLTGERAGYYVDFGSTAALAQVMRDVFVHNGTYSTFREQDWGAPVPEGIDGHAFVVCSANHDQVGNRATGDRPGASLPPAALAQAAALVLASPFSPMLFMGEEWGASTPFRFFTSHPEPELGEAVTRGRREEFGGHGWDTDEVPDPQDPETFEASRLDWSEIDAPRGDAHDAGSGATPDDGARRHHRLLAWHRDLIALRRREPALASGDRSRTRVDADDDATALVLHRAGEAAQAADGGASDGGSGVAVVLNLTDEPLPVRVEGAVEVLLAWEPGTSVHDGVVDLGAHGVALVRTRS